MHDLITPTADLENAYSVFRGIYTRSEALALTEHYAGGSDTVVEPATSGATIDPTPEDAVSRLELTRYMRNQLLRDTDVMSMAWGVELRVPFLDSPVVRHAVAHSRGDAIRTRQGAAAARGSRDPGVGGQPAEARFSSFRWRSGSTARGPASSRRSIACRPSRWTRGIANGPLLVFERWSQQLMVTHDVSRSAGDRKRASALPRRPSAC